MADEYTVKDYGEAGKLVVPKNAPRATGGVPDTLFGMPVVINDHFSGPAPEIRLAPMPKMYKLSLELDGRDVEVVVTESDEGCVVYATEAGKTPLLQEILKYLDIEWEVL